MLGGDRAPDSSLAASATCHDFASSLHSPIAVNARQLPGNKYRRFRDRHGEEQSIIQHALLNRNVLHTLSSLEQRGFKRIWYVEMDVAFTGNWGDLLRRYDAPPLDSIDILSPDPLAECSTTDSFCSKTIWSGNLQDHTYRGSTFNKARARGSPSNTPGARADERSLPSARAIRSSSSSSAFLRDWCGWSFQSSRRASWHTSSCCGRRYARTT